MRRTSSRNGGNAPRGNVMASVTRTTPSAVVKVVSSTFVSGVYRRVTWNGPSGASVKAPPRSGSSNAAKVLGESRSGRQSQSIEPSRATSATVRPSPIAA